MKLSLYFLCLIACCISSCINSIQTPYFNSYSVSGFIISESSGNDTRFYVQNPEDGEIVELKFYYDNNEDLHFEEFEYVEVSGNYFVNSNVIMVESIYSANNVHELEADDLILAHQDN